MKPEARHKQGNRLTAVAGTLGVYLLVVLLVVLGALTSRDFLSASSMVETLQNVAILGIVAVGVSFVTFSGNFADLSVPASMALSGIVAVSALRFGLVTSLTCGLLAGMAIGSINGWVIGYFRANPIIWTLVTAAVGDGFIRWAFSNKQAYPDATSPAGVAFLKLFGMSLFGFVPLTLVVLGVLLVAGQVLRSNTKFGTQLKLQGSSYEVARMTGLPTRRITLYVFLLSSFCASVAGILLASLNKVGASYIGKGYDFMAVTAIVIGGVTMAGGRGNVAGVLGGVLAIGLMGKIMTLNGFGTFEQEVVQGIVFVVVVGVSALMARRAGRDDA